MGHIQSHQIRSVQYVMETNRRANSQQLLDEQKDKSESDSNSNKLDRLHKRWVIATDGIFLKVEFLESNF